MPPQNSSAKHVIQNTAAGFFIVCVVVLSAISVLGVWDVFSSDVITKSFETLGLLAVVSIIVIVASKFVGDPTDPSTIVVPNPGFRAMRNVTLGTLIVSSAFLALLGVMAIWEVVTDKQVLGKSLSSLAIIAFSSLMIVITCLDREQSPLWEKRGKEISGGAVIAAIVFMWIMASFMFR
jgi:hypothetical protein